MRSRTVRATDLKEGDVLTASGRCVTGVKVRRGYKDTADITFDDGATERKTEAALFAVDVKED